jgi:hypothetical protein
MAVASSQRTISRFLFSVENFLLKTLLLYLSEYGQSDGWFSHLVTSKYSYKCCDVGTLHFSLSFLDAAKITTPTPLSLGESSCPHSMARPRVEEGGMASNYMGGGESCEYIE